MRTMPFNSRDTFYKSIFGSIEAYKSFKIRLLFPIDKYVEKVFAIFQKDEGYIKKFELNPDFNVLQEGFHTFSAEISLEEGLYFYSFIANTKNGERKILKVHGGFGDFAPKGTTPFQLTVYKKSFKTPDHIKGGIIYQIFPDRFFKGKNILEFPTDRYIREDWGGIPAYKQTNSSYRLGNDYFGGNLNGITEKLDYMSSLGVNIIYLNPIFEAHSNHRYNTADYFKIDSLLGSEEDFSLLCLEAKKRGIDIILDGVFSHTGEDSIYFNSKKRYGDGGAYNLKDSPYFSWYKFKDNSNDYESWWGIKSLPEVNENNASFTEFITGEKGVIKHWLRKGASGFRLDVADELPDEFLEKIRTAIKTENEENFLLGEVWEDASNKISYGKRRRFLLGNQLDSVMNYPFSKAITDFLTGGNGNDFCESVMTILENYPPPVLHSLMNHIGTHDTCRILTRLTKNPKPSYDRNWAAQQVLSPNEYKKGVKFLKLAAALQYGLVGIPSLYYGDEAGLYGYGDPFCRGCFPWGNEDTDLIEFYKKLGNARRNCSAFAKGDLVFLAVGLGFVVFKRNDGHSSAIIGVNRWCDDEEIKLDINLSGYTVVFGDRPINNTLKIKKEDFIFLIKEK